MPILPKELKNRSKDLKIHQTTPMGHAGSIKPSKEDLTESNKKDIEMKDKKHVDPQGEFLKHPQVQSKVIDNKQLVNDTAYFLHHPQIKPHGPSMPPKKPHGK
jgi:hypothetical protein